MRVFADNFKPRTFPTKFVIICPEQISPHVTQRSVRGQLHVYIKLSTTCTVKWWGKNTDSDGDSYKRKSKRKPKCRIINHQIVYESSWVKEQKKKESQFRDKLHAIGCGILVGMVRNVVVDDGKGNVCVLVT